jgi:hypothetical protein
MPTVAELERLKALVERLKPVANMQRGELIRAEDWNTTVGVLLEVARSVLAEERDTTVPRHTHSDQVGIGWLDPALRALIEKGPLADPASVTRLANMERDITRQRAQLDNFNEDVKAVRDRVSDISSRDLVREGDITAVRRKIEGLDDSRDGILDLRRTLDVLRKDVEIAVRIGQGLIVDGQPIDFNEYDRRLRLLEELRQRLTAPNGQLLDATALEIRFSELQNQFVTEEELDEALRGRVSRVDPEQLGSLREGLRAELTSNLNSSLEQFGQGIRNEVAESLNGVEAIASRAVSDAIPGVRESLRSELGTQFTRDLNARLEQEGARVNTLVNGTASNLREDFKKQLRELSDELPGQIRDGIEREFARLNRSDRENLAKLDEQTRSLDARLRRLEGQRDIDEPAFRSNLLAEASRQNDAVVKELREAIATTENQLKEQIAAVSNGIDTTALLQNMLAEALDARSRELSATLLAEMRGVVQDELANVGEKLQTALNTRLDESLAAFEKKITASLQTTVKREVAANVQELVATAVDNNLRDALPQAVNESFERLTPRLIEIVDKRLDERLPR